MEKSKLGISIGVVGALAYFLAFSGNIIPLFLLAAFIFIKEESEWLKKCAFYAVVIYVATSCLITAVGAVDDFIGLFGILFNKNFGLPFNIDLFLTRIIYILRYLVLFLFGLKAFKCQNMSIEIIDNLYSGAKTVVRQTQKPAAPVQTPPTQTPPAQSTQPQQPQNNNTDNNAQ